ncbi:hypothetical protein D3C72_1260410 [compost metagenome]
MAQPLSEKVSLEDRESEFDQETEDKLLKDCFKRVRIDFLRVKSDVLKKEIKTEPSSEKLEQIMNIQRELLSLNKG